MAPKPASPSPTQTGSTRRIRLTGLGKACAGVQRQIDLLLSAPGDGRDDPSRLAALAASIRAQADQIDTMLARRGAAAAELPAPSRRACAWLRFLGDPAQLARHVETLERITERSNQAAGAKHLPRVRVALANIGDLYRARTTRGQVEFTVHEGFIAAPPEVIEVLVQVVFTRRSRKRSSLLREFCRGEAFTRIARSLSPQLRPSDRPRGQYFDLEAVYMRVNAEYFAGGLERPRLTWSKTPTARKMGHYQVATDTVMISRTLDEASVPPFVVDYLMYHELLHKKLGIKQVNGRHYGHTAAFRAAEKQFTQYTEAAAFLQQVAQSRPVKRKNKTNHRP